MVGLQTQGERHGHLLVPSDRVEAASVYGRDGQKIGRIERLMLEKTTGAVAYAVVKCGSFLGGPTPLPGTVELAEIQLGP